MKYFTLNKPLGKNRFWVNREETNETIPNYADYNIWTLLNNKDYEIVDLDPKKAIVNFVDNNMMELTITYHKPSDIHDYIMVLFDDDTVFCYYAKPVDINIANKNKELIQVAYVMDKWSTYYPMKVALNNSNIKVLHRLKQRNRQLLNPRINEKNEYVTIFDINDWISMPPEEQYWTLEWKQDPITPYNFTECHSTYTKTYTYDLGETKPDRAFKLSLNYSSMNGYGASRDFKKRYSDIWSDNIEQAFQLRAGETKEFVKQIDKTYTPQEYVRGTMTIRVALTNIGGNQAIQLDVAMDILWHYSYGLMKENASAFYYTDNRSNIVLLMNDDIIPPIEPVTDESQNKLYIDFQQQPWMNRIMNNEEIELLPIEKKNYGHKEIYSHYFDVTYREQFNWNKTAIYRSADTTEEKNINYLTLAPLEGEEQTAFTSPIIKASDQEPTTYETPTKQQFISDDIFSRGGMYDYLVVMPSGICRRTPSTQEDPINPTNKLVNNNIWFLVPIAQYDGTFSLGSMWGSGNAITKLKEIPTIGAKASIMAHYTLPIPPTYIAMVNRAIINDIYNIWDFNNYDLTNYWGAFTYQYTSEKVTNNDIGVIPIKPQTLKFFLENNEFMNKTQAFLQRMNTNFYELPTVVENEPFLYSPSCLNMCIVPQNDDRTTYLGNDYLNLRYTLNNIGIEALFLNSAILNYSANRISDTRLVSNSRNELSFEAGLPRPMDTNPYTDYLNGSATAETTAYKVLANNKNLLGKQLGLTAISSLFGNTSLTSVLSSLMNMPFSVYGQALSGRTALKNQELQLFSMYNDIKVSSGTNVSLPPYSASCFASDSGLVIYTNYLRPDLVDDVARFRLCNGYPVNMVLPFKYYDNRQKHNVIAIDVEHNFNTIRNEIKKRVSGVLTSVSDVYVEDFINNYLTGVRLWKWDPNEDTFDPFLCENNYENDIWDDK